MENFKFAPYCKECSACGHEGCCSPLICTFGDNCDYKETYLKDLKFGYTMYSELFEFLVRKEIAFGDEEWNKIWNEKYDLIYGKS